MTDARPARVGLIGCGNVSQHYVAGCASLAAVELVACTDADPARAAALAATAGLRALPLDDLLGDPSIDVVVNLTPPVRHTEVSPPRSSGKRRLLREAAATTLADAKAILDAAAARGVRLGAPRTRSSAAACRPRATCSTRDRSGNRSGRTPRSSTSGRSSWHPDPDIFFARGGGPLLDVGPYYVAALVNLLGPIEAVEAFGAGTAPSASSAPGSARARGSRPRCPPTSSPATGSCPGSSPSFLASFDVVESTSPHLEVHGTDGSLGMGDPNTFEGEVRSGGWTTRRGRTSRPAPTAVGPRHRPRRHDRGDRRGSAAPRVGGLRLSRPRRPAGHRGRCRGPPACDQLYGGAAGLAPRRDARPLGLSCPDAPARPCDLAQPAAVVDRHPVHALYVELLGQVDRQLLRTLALYDHPVLLEDHLLELDEPLVAGRVEVVVAGVPGEVPRLLGRQRAGCDEQHEWRSSGSGWSRRTVNGIVIV